MFQSFKSVDDFKAVEDEDEKKYGPQVNCKYHPNAPLIEDHHAGDQICSECGLVVGDRVIDVSQEWKNFDDGLDHSRVGAREDPLLDGLDLTSFIEGSKRRYSKLRASDRTLLKAYDDIEEMGAKLHMGKMDEAKNLCKKMRESREIKTFQGWSMNSIVPACVNLASQEDGNPRTIREIQQVSNAKEKSIRNYTKKISKSLKMEPLQTSQQPDLYISRICSKLNFHLERKLAFKIEKMATKIAETTTEFKLMGKREPISVAATSIYLASKWCGVPLSFDQVKQVTGIISTTIASALKIMGQHVQIQALKPEMK